jgi:glycosyltransferase involved in cell wall biosynthesis
MSARGFVTCVVPVFNGEKYLAEALESVFSQTYEPIEVVVVDDGSTDSTPAILAGFGDKIRSVRQENSGPSAARNRGIEESRGDYIAFLDADDLWVAEKTATQMRRFASTPRLSVSTCLMQNFWMPELQEEASRFKDTTVARPQPGPSQTMLVQREAFDRIGLFDPAIGHRDTQDWIVRAREAGARFDQVDQVLVRRRLHANNLSRSRGERDSEDLFAIIQKKLAARSKPAAD